MQVSTELDSQHNIGISKPYSPKTATSPTWWGCRQPSLNQCRGHCEVWCVGMSWVPLAPGLCAPPAAPCLGGAPTSATPTAPSGSTVPWVHRANSAGLSTQHCNYRWVTACAPTPLPHRTTSATPRHR